MFQRLEYGKMLQTFLKVGLNLRIAFPYIKRQIPHPGSYVLAKKHSQRNNYKNYDSKTHIQHHKEDKGSYKLDGSAKNIRKRYGKGR